MCTSEAPASNAAWVDSICSDGVTGTAGLSFLRGTEPVIATAMTIGFMFFLALRNVERDCLTQDQAASARREAKWPEHT